MIPCPIIAWATFIKPAILATSGLEMSQNAMHLSWSAAEVDEKLHSIMHGIHAQCVKYGTEPDGYINYVKLGDFS